MCLSWVGVTKTGGGGCNREDALKIFLFHDYSVVSFFGELAHSQGKLLCNFHCYHSPWEQSHLKEIFVPREKILSFKSQLLLEGASKQEFTEVVFPLYKSGRKHGCILMHFYPFLPGNP